MMPTAFAANINTEIYAGSAPYGALVIGTALPERTIRRAAGGDRGGGECGNLGDLSARNSSRSHSDRNLQDQRRAAHPGEHYAAWYVEREFRSFSKPALQPTRSRLLGRSKSLLGGCEGGIYDLTIEGSGHTTTGTLLELDAIVSFSLQNLRLFNGGGRGIQINGGSERLDVRDSDHLDDALALDPCRSDQPKLLLQHQGDVPRADGG